MTQLHSIPKSLSDILTSINAIEAYLSRMMGTKRDFNIYLQDRMLRSAIERELGIIGEATNRIYKADPHYPILQNRRVIALRNRVVHSYDALENVIIWGIITQNLPELRAEVERLLGSFDPFL